MRACFLLLENRALPWGLLLFQGKGQELHLLCTAPKFLLIQLLFPMQSWEMALPSDPLLLSFTSVLCSTEDCWVLGEGGHYAMPFSVSPDSPNRCIPPSFRRLTALLHVSSWEVMPGDWLECPASMCKFHLVLLKTPQLSISLWSHSFGVKLRPFSIIDYVFISPWLDYKHLEGRICVLSIFVSPRELSMVTYLWWVFGKYMLIDWLLCQSQ